MRLSSPRSSRGRAILGLVALYGLLLQAFLAVATPSAATVDPLGFICSHDASGSPDQHHPVRHDHPCCTVAHLAPLLPPAVAATVLAWTPPDAVRVDWRPEAAIPKTGPPTRQHSARGPPLA